MTEIRIVIDGKMLLRVVCAFASVWFMVLFVSTKADFTSLFSIMHSFTIMFLSLLAAMVSFLYFASGRFLGFD